MKILVMTMLVESIWETLKMVFQEGKFSIDKVGAIIVSVIFSLAYQIDIFKMAGMESAFSYVGTIGTGIIISRGANFVHDLLSLVEESK